MKSTSDHFQEKRIQCYLKLFFLNVVWVKALYHQLVSFFPEPKEAAFVDLTLPNEVF